jgi:hypothetical protein
MFKFKEAPHAGFVVNSRYTALPTMSVRTNIVILVIKLSIYYYYYYQRHIY